MLLIDRPSKRHWILGVAGAFLIVALINVLELYRMTQKGNLTGAVGIITIKYAGRNVVPTFSGQGKTGVCSFVGCNHNIPAINGKTVAVKLDEEGRIFEIIIDNAIYFGDVNIKDSRSSSILWVLIFSVFSTSVLLFLPKEKK